MLPLLAGLAACSSEPERPKPVRQIDPALPAAPRPLVSLHERARIPGGSFMSGTEPELFERRAALEPRLATLALGPFEIDVEPYPGVGHPPLLGLAKSQASARCGDRGGRLCTELEWERACKGPSSAPFPSGATLAASCSLERGCASGYGVYGMGMRLEWTASELLGGGARSALTRGAVEGSEPALRRCAHRELHASVPEDGVAFRCCYGPPNAARVVLPRLGTAFERLAVATSEVGSWLAREPATARLAEQLSLFAEPDSVRAVLARGHDAEAGTSITSSALRWNPAASVDLIVLTGRSGPATSFIAVFDASTDGHQRVIASFTMEDEPGPVALGYELRNRERLRFGTCWNCTGEMGRIAYREPDRVLISQP